MSLLLGYNEECFRQDKVKKNHLDVENESDIWKYSDISSRLSRMLLGDRREMFCAKVKNMHILLCAEYHIL